MADIFNPVMPNVTELISPRDIKFFPNPSVYDYIVDRNSDSASDGTGNTGSLRYCMTNCASGAIIVFADVLSDSASTGNILSVKITAQLPNKNCTIYGNDHWLTASPGSYYLFYQGKIYNLYSLHIGDIFKNSGIFYGGSTVNLYGCRFERIISADGYGVICRGTSLVNYYNCDFKSIYGAYYVITYASSNYNTTYYKCNFRNCNASGGILGYLNIIAVDCFFDFYPTVFHNNSNCEIHNCYKSSGDVAYTPSVIITDSIIINGKPWVYTNSAANQQGKLIHNTIINNWGVTFLLNTGIPAGKTLSLEIKNNLIITPLYSYFLEQTIPAGTRIINESGNIYMAANSDPLLPLSTRYTGNVEALINLNEVRQNIEYVPHNYFNPVGTAKLACPRITGYENDYNGISRPDPCDCGAIQT